MNKVKRCLCFRSANYRILTPGIHPEVNIVTKGHGLHRKEIGI